jgi:acetolactate synthase-1/3 small subunit
VIAVRSVKDVSRDPNAVQRELALIKVRGSGGERIEALRVADIFRAKVIDTTLESFVFELTGTTDKIDSFIELMRPLGLVELSRTGVLSIARGVALG